MARNQVYLRWILRKTFSKKNKSSWRKKKHGGTTFWVGNNKKKSNWWRKLSWVPEVKISGKQVAKEVPARLDQEVVGSVATTGVLIEWLAHSVSMVETTRESTRSKVIKAGKVKTWLRLSRGISMNTVTTEIKNKRKFTIKCTDKIEIADQETQLLIEPSPEAWSLAVNWAR